MNDKKQNSIEWFYQRILAKNIKEVFEQAKAMHEEEIVNARQSGIDATINGKSISNIDYYNETFN